MDKIQNLVRQEKISLIALDEAHLLHLWPQFRKAYQELEHLKINFPTTPIIALTATAPPEVETTIVKILRNPFISRESINRPNIYLACEEMPGRKDFSYFASRVAELIGDSTTIIYTDFIDDIGPIVSELNECSIDCVAYHGEMDIKSRNDSYTKWRNGDIKVMVATSAFGMGIDKANIRIIIRYGVPENMCSWAQEFGRAGRDGQPSKAYIFYHTSNVEHASAWIKGNLQNHQHCQRILREFSSSWKYVTSHLVHRCRREMLLELFEEDPAIIADADKTCCDVCELEQIGTEDRFEELKMLHDAIEVLGQKGEVKLAQWLRGTSLAWGNKFNKQAYSYGCSAMHSEKWWRTFMRQCHVLGLVNKELKSIIKQSQHYGIQGVYFTTQHGKQLIETGDKLEIKTNMFNLSNDKIVSQKGKATKGPSAANSTAEKKVRKGKGTHGLNVIRALIEDKENWEEITTKHAYQFPGVFESPKMQRVYYTPNCTELEQSCSTNHHFLWDDNQLSKGSWKDREVKVNIDNEQTALIYRSAPCNGVKVCPAKDCNYVTSVSSLRSCRNHSKEKLVKTNIKCPCPVDFAYLYPKDCATDHRHWVLGFIHHQKQPVDNLHNHEIHNASKMCSMVKETIRDVAVLNPTIKPSELAKGKGVPYIPGAVDRGSSHLGRISRELQRAKHSTVGGKTWSVNNFEAVADEIDTNDSKKSGEANNELKHLCRPYLCSAGIEDGINYIFTMNPLMSQLLASSNFIEADITFNETKEFKVAAFNDTTMQWMVVSRVRLDRQGQVAHKLAFQKTFDKCKQDHPHFEPGKTLQGIVVDWSDAEIQGLGAAVGPETARYLLKGCSVHWMRSWQKIRDRVATSKDKQREKALFSQIASQIQKLAGQHISLCFEVLSGIKSAKLLLCIVTNLHEQDVQFIDEECDWSTAKHWAQWWTRPKHLAMLHKDFSKMDDIVWQKCPRDTNAVERKNRDS